MGHTETDPKKTVLSQLVGRELQSVKGVRGKGWCSGEYRLDYSDSRSGERVPNFYFVRV